MLSLVGAGAILASLAAPRLDRRYSLAALYVAGVIGSGLGFFVYANYANCSRWDLSMAHSPAGRRDARSAPAPDR